MTQTMFWPYLHTMPQINTTRSQKRTSKLLRQTEIENYRLPAVLWKYRTTVYMTLSVCTIRHLVSWKPTSNVLCRSTNRRILEISDQRAITNWCFHAAATLLGHQKPTSLTASIMFYHLFRPSWENFANLISQVCKVMLKKTQKLSRDPHLSTCLSSCQEEWFDFDALVLIGFAYTATRILEPVYLHRVTYYNENSLTLDRNDAALKEWEK